MWKNILGRPRPQMTIRRMRIACCVTRATNRAVYEIMWKNILGRPRLQMTIRPMRIACCVTRATNTHSEYAIPPTATTLHERASELRHTYIAFRLFRVSEIRSRATLQIWKGLYFLHVCSALLLSPDCSARHLLTYSMEQSPS